MSNPELKKVLAGLETELRRTATALAVAQAEYEKAYTAIYEHMNAATLIREYLLLGLRFNRVEDGYVDSYTGDPALRHTVDNEPQPLPADLARQADRLLTELPAVSGLEPARADFIGAHLRALACAGRKFAGRDVGFVRAAIGGLS